MLKGFKNQLIIFTVGMVLLTSLSLACLSYYFINTEVLSMAISYNNQIVTQLCKNISLFLDDVNSATESLSHTSSLRFYTSNFITQGVVPTREEVKLELWSTIHNQDSIDDISILYKGKKEISMFNMYNEKDLLELCNSYKENQLLVEPQLVPLIHYNKNGHPALSYITTTGDSSNLCYVISSVTIDELYDLMSNIDLGAGSGACLVDSQGSLQYSTVTEPNFQYDMNNLIKEKDFSHESSFISKLGEEKYIISAYPLTDSKLSAIVYIPLKNITEVLSPLLLFILIFILFILFIFSFMSIKISNRLTTPIITLANYMSAIDTSRFDALPSPNGTKEIDILYHTFQHMMDRINKLIEENKQENKLKRHAELRALQSQINPHFLYNTLDSINALAILNNESDISKMTISLGTFLRRSIADSNEYHSLKNEFEHVKAYISIQKIRYDDLFSVTYHIDSTIVDFPVVRLILQPLVENCIYHGFELKNGPGHLEISATDCVEYIQIKISDDGIGVSQEKAEYIQHNLNINMQPEGNFSIGIYNVNSRLRLYYGKAASITFDSVERKGTTVTINIPKNKEDTHVENHVS